MKTMKILGPIAMAVAALVAFGGATASATTLEVKGVKQPAAVAISGSLETNTSLIMKDSAGTTFDTCTGSTFEGKGEAPFTGASVGGDLAKMTFTNCSHTTHVLAPGRLSFTWIKGTTNGTVISSGAEWQMQSTFFGVNAVCKTGAGTDFGTLTGKQSGGGQATIDLSATISCGILGNMSWTGSYVITSPTELGVAE